jgi:O-succinylbenzoic acid--CoA ligase
LGKIITKNGFFSFAEIKNRPPALANDYERDAVNFCHDWLNKKKCFTLFTSGSTGIPKPIELLREQMEVSASSTVSALGLKSGDTSLVCLNTQYIAGIMMLVRGMVLDMNMIITPITSSPLSGLDENTKIDFTALVPLQLQTILEEGESKSLKILNLMKAIIVGGASLSSALEDKIQKLSSPVYSTYGMTETVSHIALRRLNGKDRQDYFKTLPGISIDIDDRGCLKIFGKVTKDTWLNTNDLVKLLDKDKFVWLGRIDNTINTGGIKIQPEKVEKALEKILSQDGRRYFIAALPHPKLGEAVTLFLEGKEMIDSLLHEKIRSCLDKFEMPKAVLYIDAFPMSATGKIEKKKLQDSFKDYFTQF